MPAPRFSLGPQVGSITKYDEHSDRYWDGEAVCHFDDRCSDTVDASLVTFRNNLVAAAVDVYEANAPDRLYDQLLVEAPKKIAAIPAKTSTPMKAALTTAYIAEAGAKGLIQDAIEQPVRSAMLIKDAADLAQGALYLSVGLPARWLYGK